MKLLNHEVRPFLEVLFEMKLKGKESRLRTRLHKMIAQYLTETLNIEHDEIINQYAEKDEKGNQVIDEVTNGVKIQSDSVASFEKDYNELMLESYIIEENESNKEMLITVGNALLNCDVELNGNLAMLFDTWCERFEEVIENYANKEEL